MKMKIILLTIFTILFTSCGFEELLVLTGLDDAPAYSNDSSSSTEAVATDSGSNSDSSSDEDADDDATPTYATIVDYASITVGKKKASAIVALTDGTEADATVIITSPGGDSKTLVYDSTNSYYLSGGITASSGETFTVSVTVDGTVYTGTTTVN